MAYNQQEKEFEKLRSYCKTKKLKLQSVTKNANYHLNYIIIYNNIENATRMDSES